MILITENGEERSRVLQAQHNMPGVSQIRRDLEVGDRIIVLSDPFEASTLSGGRPAPYPMDAVDEQLTSLVGHTVIAANAIVSAWAMLYAVVSGHSLPFVASLFDKWARENVQRERMSKLSREFLHKLPRELEQVENLLAKAESLARERELLVSQPWSLGYLDEPVGDRALPIVHGDIVVEREVQFEGLLASHKQFHLDIMMTVAAFRVSRDVEKVRVLNRSGVLAAEFKFGRKAARPKSGPRHKEWPQPLMA